MIEKAFQDTTGSFILHKTTCSKLPLQVSLVEITFLKEARVAVVSFLFVQVGDLGFNKNSFQCLQGDTKGDQPHFLKCQL